MRIDFTKMHGVGNDFVVFDAPADESLLAPELLRRLGERRTGIGFDQALVLERPRREGTAVFYRIFNRDGDEVEQCGNGARCIAALFHHRGAAADGTITLDSPAGIVQARIDADRSVSVDMGVPDFDPRSLPFDAPSEADSYPLEVAARTLEIVSPSEVRLRVYERGAGETLSCGTGACAAVAVGRRRRLLDREVLVKVRGGELRVNWAGPGEHVWLSGPAEISFAGHVEV
jgi:diaminopimelate epimerase